MYATLKLIETLKSPDMSPIFKNKTDMIKVINNLSRILLYSIFRF